MRVVECFTGSVGSQVIRLLAEHPQLDLIGVQVRSEAKDGRDAGELAGIGPIGIIATRSADELIALRPDAVLWLGDGWHPDRSEEHTSELQSHLNLVCRLLLEKKKIRKRPRRLPLSSS